MFDSVSLNIEDVKLNDFEDKISVIRTINENTGMETERGYFKNFRLTNDKYSNGVFLNGSLCKYFFNGCNTSTLNRKTTKEALEKLSDELNINIPDCKIFRFDIGTNFLMKDNSELYYKSLGSLNYFNRSNYNESIYYKNRIKELIFYDKYRELKNKNLNIPDEYLNYENKILRYESRFMKQAGKQFNRHEIKGRDLFSESFYIAALRKWQQLYFSIHKINKIKFSPMALKNVKSLNNQLMFLGIKYFGFDEILNIIELSKSDISKNQYYRAKKKVKSLMGDKDLTEPNELITELNKKIIESVEIYN